MIYIDIYTDIYKYMIDMYIKYFNTYDTLIRYKQTPPTHNHTAININNCSYNSLKLMNIKR